MGLSSEKCFFFPFEERGDGAVLLLERTRPNSPACLLISLRAVPSAEVDARAPSPPARAARPGASVHFIFAKHVLLSERSFLVQKRTFCFSPLSVPAALLARGA
jgi:hypothetical protein